MLLLQVAAGVWAQASATAESAMNFLGAMQAGQENEALAMLERDTNLVRTVDNLSKYPLLEAAADGEAKLVKRLLELGADINVQGDILASGGSQSTALHWAVQRGHLEACQVLLAAGADPNRMAFGYQTPL